MVYWPTSASTIALSRPKKWLIYITPPNKFLELKVYQVAIIQGCRIKKPLRLVEAVFGLMLF